MPRAVDPRTLILVIVGLVGLEAKFPAAAAVAAVGARVKHINAQIVRDGLYNTEGLRSDRLVAT